MMAAHFRHVLRYSGAGVAGLALLGSLAGCGTSSAASSVTGEPTVTIGYQNGSDPQTVAIEQGFFQKDLHAHVHLKYFSSGPDALTAMASGTLDFMTGLGSPPVVAAIAKKVPLKIIWIQDRYATAEGLVVKNSSGIASLKNLEGKTVALVAGSTSPWELDTALTMQHIPLSSVHIDNTAPANMVAAWKTGQIDAAYVWSPFLNLMQKDGGHIVVYDQNQVKTAPNFTVAVVNASFAKKYPQLV
ncbi:MAG: ABC transporter substrate-binding protein, partial [Firmicutes bacterium]|nr:ABC transporter substrate-binding protein [Bacillota bacterium]